MRDSAALVSLANDRSYVFKEQSTWKYWELYLKSRRSEDIRSICKCQRRYQMVNTTKEEMERSCRYDGW